jgi:hypothetical protein
MSYFEAYIGRFVGVMQMPDCLELLQTMKDNPNHWFVYDTLIGVPTQVENANDFIQKINQIKMIIDSEHDEKYCGIVYADDLKKPTFIKIFHPKNLGKSCGSSEYPPIAQWLISKKPPQDIIKKFGETDIKQGFISKFFK